MTNATAIRKFLDDPSPTTETLKVGIALMHESLERMLQLVDGPLKDTITVTAGIHEKRCAHCGKMKPIESFGVDSKRKDGHNSVCGTRKEGCLKRYYDSRKPKKVTRSRAVGKA